MWRQLLFITSRLLLGRTRRCLVTCLVTCMLWSTHSRAEYLRARVQKSTALQICRQLRAVVVQLMRSVSCFVSSRCGGGGRVEVLWRLLWRQREQYKAPAGVAFSSFSPSALLCCVLFIQPFCSALYPCHPLPKVSSPIDALTREGPPHLSTLIAVPGETAPCNPPNTNPPFAPFKGEAADYTSFIPKQPEQIGALASTKRFAQNKNVPKLFEPITIRGVTWPHRMWVAPMCMCEYTCRVGMAVGIR